MSGEAQRSHRNDSAVLALGDTLASKCWQPAKILDDVLASKPDCSSASSIGSWC
jgi:hypothetical protein